MIDTIQKKANETWTMTRKTPHANICNEVFETCDWSSLRDQQYNENIRIELDIFSISDKIQDRKREWM